jgi:hypothetical protein
MALKLTKSKINSNPKNNSAFIVGEGDIILPKLMPIEQFEVKNPNIVPNVDFVLPKTPVVIKPTFDDVPIQRIVQASKLVKVSSNAFNVINVNLATAVESNIRLIAGNARTVRTINQTIEESSNPVQTNTSEERPFRTKLTNIFSYNAQSELPKETVSAEFVPEAKVLALMDLSKLKQQDLEELIIARRLESDIDDKLLRSLLSLIERDKANADYIYSVESEIREEIVATESILNTVNSFDSLIDYTRNSLSIGKNRNALHESFLNQLRTYDNNVTNVEEMQATFENDFIKVFENLNAMEDADGVDPQFLVWKNLESISDALRNGISNRYISEQSASGFSLEYLNFDYDGSFDSFKQFDVMHLSGFDPLERIFYYITSMCNELNQSIGLGTLQAQQTNVTNGNDWLQNNVGLPEDWLNYENNIGLYSNMFVKVPNDEEIKPLMRLGLEGTFNAYLTDFKKNVKFNKYQDYESVLLKTQQEFISFQNNALKLINLQESKKKLLEPKNLFKRIFETFNEIISDLNQSIINNQSETNSNKLISLLLLSLTAGSLSGDRFKLKHQIFNLMLNSLNKIRLERKSNDLKLFSNFNENQSVPIFLNNIKGYLNKFSAGDFIDSYFSFDNIDLEKLIESINSSNLKKDLVFHKILEIFLELEKECIDIINKKQFKIEFLTEEENKTGKTKFSNLDAFKFCYMIYEIFCVLTQVFLKFSVKKKNATSIANNSWTMQWSAVSDDIKESLKSIPKAIEKDDFQSFFNSFKTITANDNIGMRNNVYGGMVTAQSFYELNESFKKEQATIPFHLASIQTVIENFVTSTSNFNDYTKLLRGDASVQDSKLTNEQKNLKNFLSTEIGEQFFDDINKLRIARARLRLLKLKSLVKPYDLAAIEPAIYDALQLYIKNKNYFETKNQMILVSVDQSVLKELVSLDYSDRFRMNLKVTKVNELQDVRYTERSLAEFAMGYCLTKDLLNETVQESESKGLNILSSLSELARNIKLFDMSNSRATSEVEELFGSSINDNDNGKRALLESYLAASLVEVIARIDVDMPGTFKNDVGYNVDVARRMLDMAGAVLGVEDAFENVFKVDGNELKLRDQDEVQRNFRSEASIVSEKGTTLQLDDGFDYAKFDLMHTLLDTIYFRKGRIKQMVFSDNSTAQVFGIPFDPDDFVYENDFTSDDDNEVRFDSLYLETEFLQ